MDGKLKSSRWNEIKLQNLQFELHCVKRDVERSSRKCSKTIQFALKCINVEIYFHHAMRTPSYLFIAWSFAPHVHNTHTKQRTTEYHWEAPLGKSEHDT